MREGDCDFDKQIDQGYHNLSNNQRALAKYAKLIDIPQKEFIYENNHGMFAFCLFFDDLC